MYDDRDECYAHFLNVVRLKRQWEALYYDLKGKRHKQLEDLMARYIEDELTYEKALQLSAEDLSTLQKAVNTLQKKVNRKNTFLYIFGGAALGELIALITLASLK